MDDLLKICRDFGMQPSDLFKEVLDDYRVENLHDLIESYRNTDFIEALKKAIDGEENSGDQSRFLNDLLEAAQPGNIMDVLQQSNLAVPKFLPRFREAQLLTSRELERAKGEYKVFKDISLGATEEEKSILASLLDIASEIVEENELSEALTVTGLDASVWKEILFTRFGIRSTHDLAFLDSSNLSVLMGLVRSEEEKRSLQNLLGFRGDLSVIQEVDFNRQRANSQKEKILKMIQIFEGAEKAEDREKTRARIEVALGITKGNDAKEYGRRLSDSEAINACRKVLNSWNEGHDCKVCMVASQASDGLALRGVYFSRDLKDQMAQREQVFNINDQIQLEPAVMDNKEFIVTFENHQTKEQFSNLLNQNGYSLSSIIKEHPRFGVGNQSKYSCFEIAHKYVISPTASITLDPKSISLSRSALLKLKGIEGMAPERIQDSCQAFFKRFGSHVNMGTIHFGGIFCWGLSVAGNIPTGNTEAKLMDALEKFANMTNDPLNSNKDKINQYLSESFASPEAAELSISTSKDGGKVKAETFAQWRKILGFHPCSWQVVDRGTAFIGIWDLLEAHKAEFNDHTRLISLLRTTWERTVGLSSSQILNNMCVGKYEERTSQLIEMAKIPLLYDNCEEIISHMISLKKILVMETCSFGLWTQCLSFDDFKKFFRSILEIKDKHDMTKITELLCQFFFGAQFQDDLASNEAKEVSSWVSQDANYNQVGMDFLRIILQQLYEELMAGEKRKGMARDANIAATWFQITHLGQETMKCLRIQEMLDEALLIETLLKLLDEVGNISGEHLADVFAEWLKIWDECSKTFAKFVARGPEKAEHCLIYLIADLSRKSSHKGEKIAIDMVRKVHAKYDSTKKALSEHNEPPVNLSKMNIDFRTLLDGVKIGEVNQENLSRDLKACQDREEAHQAVPSSMRVDKSKFKSKWRKSKEFDIIEQLGLSSFYPGKITLHDVIKRAQFSIKLKEDVPWFVLNGIISLDYASRNGSYVNELYSDSETEQASGDDFLDDLFDTKDSKEVQDVVLIHPIDALMATMLCSTLDLVQILCERLFKCRLSIPLILLDSISKETTFLSWSLRNIVCEFENLDNDEALEVPVIQQPMHFVSFLRVGELKNSKSKLINDIISALSGQDHCTFFHREISGGRFPRLLTNGLLEMAWYFPSKKTEKNGIKLPIGFLNLRGLAARAQRQVEFVINLSNLVILMLDINDLFQYRQDQECLDKIIKSSQTVLLIIYNDGMMANSQVKEALGTLKMIEQKFPGKVQKKRVILDFNVGMRDNKGVIIDGIQKITQSSSPKIMEEYFACAANLFLHSEESGQNCLKGKQLALNVIREMENENPSEIKEKQLPLQGGCWIKWVQLTKAEKRPKLSNYTIKDFSEHAMAKIAEEKRNLRKEQLSYCDQLPKLTSTFLFQLMEIKDNTESENETCYFYLKWLRLYLDEKCRKTLPRLHREYTSTWINIQDSRKNVNGSSPLLESKKRDLKLKEEQIVASSLGLEHLIRELGQMYEAIATLPNEVNHNLLRYSKMLPSLIAQLMINGHPLEIMDGDASFVPVTWIKEVFRQLKKHIGDKKLFVLSVLGLQSSGKSTLLNAMFGLQFAVSAGRCTRGVFAQLVPVERSELNKTFDYILVVDAEGLRAPELGTSTYQHDHELAMFVVGLGDATILNIKGEIQAEMQDVLQIVVHAFIRLHRVNNNIKLQPSCLLIHQNVSAISASQKMMYVQQKLQDVLDTMTTAAAEQEGRDNIAAFRDVIEFDPVKHVWYFSDLWQGDPPMAPANPGYSRNIATVKQFILETLLSNDNKGQSISEFTNRLNDLWQGILQEDFIFSFKNSIEIRAFTRLEQIQGTIEWEGRSEALRLINVARHKMFGWDEQRIEMEHKELLNHLVVELRSYFTRSDRKLEDFFQNSQDKLVMEQWKQRSHVNLHITLSDELKHLERECNKFAEARKLQLRLGQSTASYKDSLVESAKELAADLRSKGDQNIDLRQHFSKFWTDFTQNLFIQSTHEDVNVQQLVQFALFKIYPSKDHIFLYRELEYQGGKFPITKRDLLYILQNIIDGTSFDTARTCWGWSNKRDLDAREYKLIMDNVIEREIAKIDKRLDQTKNTKPTDITAEDLLKPLYDHLCQMNNDKNRKFGLPPNFIAGVMVSVSRFLTFELSENYDSYQKKNDPLGYLRETHYSQLESYFICLVEQRQQEQTAADILCEYLKRKLWESVMLSQSRLLAEDVRGHHSWCYSKEQLIIKILSDFARAGTFENLFSFTRNIRQCMDKCLEKYINEYLFRLEGPSYRRRYSEVMIKHLEDLIVYVRESFSRSLANAGGRYLEDFRETISDRLTFSIPDLHILSDQSITDVNFFDSCVRDCLVTIERELVVELSCQGPEVIQQSSGNVYQLMLKECAGCTEQCPLCRSPCSLTDPDHLGKDVKHSCIQHYPLGVSGANDHISRKLDIEACTTDVCGDRSFKNAKTNLVWHPFKEYEKIYPDWHIARDASMDASLFFKWYLANYADDLVRVYECKMPDVPEEWKNISMEEAIESLTRA